MINNKKKERDAIIKELSVSYNHSIKDISKILKDKSFKIDPRILESQMRYFRWDAIMESMEQGGYMINEKSVNLMNNYLDKYPDCYRTLAVKGLF